MGGRVLVSVRCAELNMHDVALLTCACTAHCSSLKAPVRTMIKVEPETGSDHTGKSDNPSACHSKTLTAAGVAAALAEDSCSTPIQQNCVGGYDEEQQDGVTPREGSCRKSGSGLLRPAADSTEEDVLDTRLTLEFLEENGYFDMPIQVSTEKLHKHLRCHRHALPFAHEAGSPR